MEKIFKSVLYLAACVAVFVFIVQSYGPASSSDQSANVFEWEKTVNLYFINKQKAAVESCEADAVVQRRVTNAETLGPGAIEALIRGLTQEEKSYLSSSINPSTLVQKFEIKEGTAYIDFNSNLNSGVAGSCNVIAIRSQIENTLIALPDIDAVVISVNGQTEGILEP